MTDDQINREIDEIEAEVRGCMEPAVQAELRHWNALALRRRYLIGAAIAGVISLGLLVALLYLAGVFE